MYTIRTIVYLIFAVPLWIILILIGLIGLTFCFVLTKLNKIVDYGG